MVLIHDVFSESPDKSVIRIWKSQKPVEHEKLNLGQHNTKNNFNLVSVLTAIVTSHFTFKLQVISHILDL